MSTQTPAVGRSVHYELSEQDAAAITKRRYDFQKSNGGKSETGFQAHVGNRVDSGDVFPATIVRVNGTEPHQTVNLRVILDGTDDYWATSRSERVTPDELSDGEVQTAARWFWPPRV